MFETKNLYKTNKQSQNHSPIALELRNRPAGFPLIPPLKTKPITPGGKLHRRRPFRRGIRNQPITIENPATTQPRTRNPNQIDPPIFPNGHTLSPTVLHIDTRHSPNVQLLRRHRALGLERGVDGVGEEEVEGAGEGGGGDEGFVRWCLGGLEGGDSGRRRKCGLRG